MTVNVEFRAAPVAARDVPISQQSAKEAIRQIWPLFVVGLGLIATLAWMTLLGWLVYRAMRLLLA